MRASSTLFLAVLNSGDRLPFYSSSPLIGVTFGVKLRQPNEKTGSEGPDTVVGDGDVADIAAAVAITSESFESMCQGCTHLGNGL